MIMHCELCTYNALSRHLRPSSCTEFIYCTHKQPVIAVIQCHIFISNDLSAIMRRNKASLLFERIWVDFEIVYAAFNIAMGCHNSGALECFRMFQDTALNCQFTIYSKFTVLYCSSYIFAYNIIYGIQSWYKLR